MFEPWAGKFSLGMENKATACLNHGGKVFIAGGEQGDRMFEPWAGKFSLRVVNKATARVPAHRPHHSRLYYDYGVETDATITTLATIVRTPSPLL